MDIASECNSPGGIAGGNQTAKRKFFQWAVKWFYANMAEDNLEKPDAPVLVSLLQSIGFQLREFEKIEEPSDRTKESKPAGNTVRLFVECGTSGMRACLELNDVKCKCPNSETAKEASFWSVSGVSGTGSTSTANIKSSNRIEESGSNLLPPLAKETNKILHDVTYHLLNIIADKSPDINQNSKNHSNLNLSALLNTTNKDVGDNAAAEKLKKLSSNIVRSYTQPEIVLPHASARKFRWNIVPLDKTDSDIDRNGSKWSGDLESEIIDNDQPRPSPPKIASSPVFMNQFCNSLSQISLHSEEEAGNVAEHVIQARKSLDKALEILMAKKSPKSRNSPNFEEGTFLKPAPGGLNLTGGGGSSRLSTSSNGSLRSSSGGIRPRQSSSFSLPQRESSSTGPKKTISQTTASKPPTSNITRRSVGPAALSTSMVASSFSGGTIKRQSSNVDQNATKIPGRRKSFGVLGSQPLKLAATSARLTASSLKRKSPEPKGTTLNQSSTQKVGSSINQPAPNLKYGFARKKSSLV